MKSRGVLTCFLAVVVGCLFGAGRISAGVKILVQPLTTDEAAQHVQETNTVCGPIASTKYLENGRDNPTYLNFDQPFPKQTFTAVITEAGRARFRSPPEITFKGKNVCVTGIITLSDYGKPQIIVEDPSQIRIDNTPPPATNQTTQGTSP